MNIDDETLNTVIAQHTVLLNRPAWLDPDRLDLQRDVWKLLIDEYRRVPGKLIVRDFIQAAAGQIRETSTAASVLPSTLVDAAVARASARYELAAERINQDPAMLLYTETGHLKSAIERAFLNDESGLHRELTRLAVDAAIVAFRVEVDSVRRLLDESGYDEKVISPALAVIDQLEAEYIGRANRYEPTPTRIIEKPSLADVAEVERLMREGS